MAWLIITYPLHVTIPTGLLVQLLSISFMFIVYHFHLILYDQHGYQWSQTSQGVDLLTVFYCRFFQEYEHQTKIL